MPFLDPAAKRAADRQRYLNRKAAEPDYYQANNAARPNRKKPRSAPFVGCDGEGYTDSSGRHILNMFRIGDELLSERPGEKGLRTADVLDFICGQDPSRNYVGYFFNYDVTMIIGGLNGLNQERIAYLVDRGRRTSRKHGKTFPVDWGPFRIEWMPTKFFEVSKIIPGKSYMDEFGQIRETYSPRVTIQDVGSFFQCSFVRALEQWEIATPDERERIKSTKIIRGDFTPDMFDEVADYNRRECVYLEELMEKFRDTCLDLDLVPKSWTGPGQLVEALLEKEGYPRSADIPLLQDESQALPRLFAQNAYYGGRNEVSKVGFLGMPVYQYDINSAYPYAMVGAPCLVHGHFYEASFQGRQSEVYEEPLALCYGTFAPKVGAKCSFYGLPMRRRDGSIFFPAKGKGWYWSFEIQAAQHQTFTAESVWSFRTHCDCKPLGFVEGLYLERLKLGKTSKGIALKLILNSIYGKMAQSVGSPKYSNPIYASFFTAKCRAQVQWFLHSNPACVKRGVCGADVVMIATDSVASLYKRPDLKPQKVKKLGGWDLDTHEEGMFIVQSGLYFSGTGASKTRGIPKAVLEDSMRGRFEEAFRRFLEHGDINQCVVRVPTRTFFGLKVVASRRNWKLLGQWHDEHRDIGFSWLTKRLKGGRLSDKGLAWNFLPEEERTLGNVFLDLFPIEGDGSATVPYDKNIGGLAVEIGQANRDEGDDQPDWAPGWGLNVGWV